MSTPEDYVAAYHILMLAGLVVLGLIVTVVCASLEELHLRWDRRRYRNARMKRADHEWQKKRMKRN